MCKVKLVSVFVLLMLLLGVVPGAAITGRDNGALNSGCRTCAFAAPISSEPITDWQRYEDPDFKLALEYPDGWKVETTIQQSEPFSDWVSAGAAMLFQDTQSSNSPAVSSHLDFRTDTRLSDEDKIKATIDAYFKLRYEGQRLLEAQDFSELVQDAKQPWVEREKDKRDIELYIASLFELNFLYRTFLGLMSSEQSS
jgi:hypothetical protein